MDLIIPKDETLNLLSPQDLTGEFQTTAISDAGKQRLYHHRQTIGGILNDIERQRIDQPNWRRDRNLRHIATVPDIVWTLWESMGITSDDKELRKALMRHKDEYMVVEQEIRK